MPTVVVGLCCVAAFFGVATAALTMGRGPAGGVIVYGASLLVSLAGLANGVWHLVAGAPAEGFDLAWGLPGTGAHFRVDALAAFFLCIVNLGGAAASLYAIGHARHEPAPLRVLPFFPAYLAGMNLVLVADDAFAFLAAWAFTSLTSWALVMAHHERPDTRRAGFIYLLMASFGTLALLAAFGVLAGADGSYGFDAIRAHRPEPFAAGLVFLLVLVGAGSKAGLAPLHVALPLAHPAAPDPVSALMSGVMTKVAVYGFVRIVFDLLGPPAWWWSLIVLAVAGVTAVLGVLYALMQHDLKRLLAYSTMENIGIVFIGLGLAMAFRAGGMALPAALALTAALFHVLNHSIIKSLLFFGVGAVVHSTGERSMERLGGLIHRMPRTAVAVLTGCVAISALPPLNGFVSEWLTFQAILAGLQLPRWGLRFVIPAVGGMLALATALTAACFVKFYGVAFLGRPRTPQAGNAQEADRFSLAAMLILAGLCCLAGLFPGVIVEALLPVVQGLLGARMPAPASWWSWTTVAPVTESRGSYNGTAILIYLLGAVGLAVVLIHRFASRTLRRDAAWDGGYPDASASTQVSGAGFAMPFRHVFGATAFGVHTVGHVPAPGETRAAALHVRVLDPAWRLAYGPAQRGVLALATRLDRLQILTTRGSLTLVFVTLIALLLVVAAWR